MAGEAADRSWHPALMPNTAEDTPRSAIEPELEATTPRVLDQNDDGTSQELAAPVDAWFSNDGHDDEGGAWLASDQPSSQDQAATDEAKPEPTHESAATPTAGHSASQHSSSMSFARTAHEVNLDDDDGDWSLPRTDTDPFKFMSPSDRTNSFPVVPNAAPIPDPEDAAPLPSSQALDVVEETERDFLADEHQFNADDPSRPDTLSPPQDKGRPRGKHSSSGSIGGDVQPFEAEASASRYEEGVPLISHANDDASRALGSFEEDGGDDDFFTQAQGVSTQETQEEEPEIQALERKSTMQVLGAMTPEPISRQNTLGEAILEEDEIPAGESKTVHNDTPATEDLSAKWQEAFGGDDDDDEFLLEDSATEDKKDFDPADFLGSDDEGFLDDADDATHETLPAPASQPGASGNAYTPQASMAQQPANSYMGAPVQPAQSPLYSPSVPTTPVPHFNTMSPYGSVPQPPRPEAPRAESFAGKSKGGYTSPYDLPTDLVSTTVKPRKRTSMQQLATTAAAQAPMPRSTSMYTAGPPPAPSSRPPSSHGAQGPAIAHKASAPVLRSGGSFFEDLPMAPKPRPTSRHSNRAPSPQMAPPPLPSKAHSSGPPLSHHMAPPTIPEDTTPDIPPPMAAPPPGSNLVAPERISPYAALPTSAPSVPPPPASRYSPSSAQLGSTSGAPPAAAASRYSPAPAASRANNAFSPTGQTAVPAPMLPHQPRTSSPLAHFEVNNAKHQAAYGINGDPPRLDRRSSSSYEPRLARVSSLPPTREVEEEEDKPSSRSLSATHAPSPPLAESRYSPAPPASQPTLSPTKRAGSNYAPQPTATAQPSFAPPPRAHTLSPGATRSNKLAARSPEAAHRPMSAHSSAAPASAKPTQQAYAPGYRVRGQSLTMNMVAPTDGREHDPLERWKGVPVLTWGVGGTMVTSFPQSVPRYGMNQASPNIIRSLGEVKVRNIRDIEPLQDRLTKFPGPLKGKSKKKEALAWLSAGIETLEHELPDVSFHAHLSLEAKRAIERLILWRILRVFIEHDGVLEGNPAVEKAVRDILSPGTITPTSDNDALFPGSSGLGTQSNPLTSMQADGADAATMELMRQNLLKGDREAAVWSAVDKRLWGHAMLISHTVSPELYKQVAQEFVRKEVNYSGHSNESIGALYKVLSGNFDDCVDELVPVHARAGLQLVSTETSSGPSKDALDGLDKWRETLTLILSNRSVDDIKGLKALGNLLSNYGRAEAAHICYIFSRNVSVFGGLDDPNVDFVVLGSDHRQQPDQFAKETEALQLTEVYEYGLSLGGGPAAIAGAPHLAAYKLQHAITLAEYGYRNKALEYCEAIATAMTSQTRRSPYHHAVLVSAVDDFMTRLKQAPKGETASWMGKPSMNKVSDSMWNRFNKFVAGEDNENNANGAAGDGENGPFARIASSPNLSRSPSVSNFEMYGSSPGYPAGAAPAPPAIPSRYAPMATQPASGPSSYEPASHFPPAPRLSAERNSNEFSRSPYEPGYLGASLGTAQNGSYLPSGRSASGSSYQPDGGAELSPALHPVAVGHPPFGLQESPILQPHSGGAALGGESAGHGYQPSPYGYEPPQMATGSAIEDETKLNEGSVGGYEPPSFQPYGYEPPSYEPPQNDLEDDAPKPKKKSFMDDDDDIPALRPQGGNTKSDKDRENEEMFRKAAEEDAKRAAQQGGKKGWGFGGWFGGKKPESPSVGEQSPNKPVRAKLGEASSFVYDPDLKRWVNKKPGADVPEPKTATPPPPRAIPRANTSTPPMMPSTPPPPMSASTSMPHLMGAPRSIPDLARTASSESLGMAPPMARSVSNTSIGGPPSAPPSRPTTSMSNASSIDDLIGAAGPRRPGQKKPRKSGRYIDVMAK